MAPTKNKFFPVTTAKNVLILVNEKIEIHQWSCDTSIHMFLMLIKRLKPIPSIPDQTMAIYKVKYEIIGPFQV